jgi:arginase
MPKPFTLILAPFHLGLEDVAVGAGPKKLLEAGADQILSTRGMPAQVVHTRGTGNPVSDLDAITDINRQIRQAVMEAVDQDSIPVTLAGNCLTCLGTLAGLDTTRLGVVWLDAHGDFHTPESSVTGYLDGMALATALGHCHEELRERTALETPPDERNTLLLGVRDLDEPSETDRLAQSMVAVRPHNRLEDVQDLLEDLRSRVDGIYLHLDIDFLYPGGLSAEDGEALVARVLTALPLTAVNLTNFDPAIDRGGANLKAAIGLLRMISACR